MNSGHPGRWPSHLYLSSVWEQRELIIQPPFFPRMCRSRAPYILSCVIVNPENTNKRHLKWYLHWTTFSTAIQAIPKWLSCIDFIECLFVIAICLIRLIIRVWKNDCCSINCLRMFLSFLSSKGFYLSSLIRGTFSTVMKAGKNAGI